MDKQDEKGHHIHARSGRKVYERSCSQCQTTFFPARTDQVYCCESCRVMAYRRRLTKSQEASQKETPTSKPTRKLGDVGSITGIEMGDLALGVVAGNALTSLGKSLLGVKSSEQKALERIEQKLEQINPGSPPSRPDVRFTGRSFYTLALDRSVLTVVEVLVNNQNHYLDNSGRLFIRDSSGLKLVNEKGREALGLP